MRQHIRQTPRLLGLVAVLACVLWVGWTVPGQAVEIVRKSSRQVKVDPPPSPKEKEASPADTTGSVRELLNDVRSQKEEGASADTLDTWIDRDGDGVNDRLKKSAAPEGTKIKSFQPSGGSKEAKPSAPARAVKKTKSASPDSAAKKRRR